MSAALSMRQDRNAYDLFARIYNRSIAETFCRQAFPVVERLMLRDLQPRARVLDLCCGSGQMARQLSQRGYQVTGLDGSPKMIEQARRNAPQAQFVLADARKFCLQSKFDAVLSSFNSLAHASTAKELLAVFACVRDVLRPGGILLFDLSMEEQYAMRWRGCFGELDGIVTWIVRPSYNPESKIASNHVSVFESDGGEIWKRSDFTIQQKCHSKEEILAALAAAGFFRVESFDAERDLGMRGESGRLFFRAK